MYYLSRIIINEIIDLLLGPILPATLPRSFYLFLFVISWLLLRAFIAFGYFVHGCGLFDMSELNLSLGFVYFFSFSTVLDCTLQYALCKAPLADMKLICKPFFTLSLELPSLLTGSCFFLPVGITLVSSCTVTGLQFLLQVGLARLFTSSN